MAVGTIQELLDEHIKIDSSKADGTIRQFFTPKIEERHGVAMDAYIAEVSININIQSLAEFPRIESPSALATQKEIDDNYWNTAKNIPYYLMEFYYSQKGSDDPLYKFGMCLFNIRPSYTEQIKSGYTDIDLLVVPFGAKLYYKISGLQPADKITLNLIGSYEAEFFPGFIQIEGIPSSIVIDDSIKQIAPKNTKRACLSITNSGERIAYLSLKTNAIAGAGRALTPGSAFEINNSNYSNESVFAVCKNGESTILDIQESEF